MNLLYLLIVAIPISAFIGYMVFSTRRLSPVLALIIGLYPVVFLYLVSANWRFFSFHGLLHTSIIYHIIEHGCPPQHPFLAGQPLLYSWGYHALAALLVGHLNICPPYIFALINILSLAVVMILVYKTSILIVQEQRASLFACLGAVFANTILPSSINVLNGFIFDSRGAPAILKCTNASGLSLGLAAYSLCLHSLVMISQNKRHKRSAILLCISVLAVGFLYTPLLPGMVVGIASVFIIMIIFRSRFSWAGYVYPLIHVASPLLWGLVLIFPYFTMINSGVSKAVRLGGPSALLLNLPGIVALCGPISALIYWQRKRILRCVERKGLLVLLCMIISNLVCYMMIKLPYHNEYKFTVLAMFPLGLLGGIAASEASEGKRKWLLFALILAFTGSLYHDVYRRLNWMEDIGNPFREEGSHIYLRDKEEDLLNFWLRDRTPKDCILIDSEFTCAVTARRALYVGCLLPEGVNDYCRSAGFGDMDGFLRRINGYDPALIDRRKDLARAIFSGKVHENPQALGDLFATEKDVYIVLRSAYFENRIEAAYFKEVFRTEKARFLVFKLKRH